MASQGAGTVFRKNVCPRKKATIVSHDILNRIRRHELENISRTDLRETAKQFLKNKFLALKIKFSFQYISSGVNPVL